MLILNNNSNYSRTRVCGLGIRAPVPCECCMTKQKEWGDNHSLTSLHASFNVLSSHIL